MFNINLVLVWLFSDFYKSWKIGPELDAAKTKFSKKCQITSEISKNIFIWLYKFKIR